MTIDEMIDAPLLAPYNPTPADSRCDACGSRAYVRYTKQTTEQNMTLETCGHHSRKLGADLLADMWTATSRLDILEKECEAYKSKSTGTAF